MNIKLEANTLKAYFEYHVGSTTLQPNGGNEFLFTFSNLVLGIHPAPFAAENGKVNSVTIKVNDFVEYDTYEFVKVD